MGVRIGVDAGGTFTDVCAFDEERGTVEIVKVSSTPADPGAALLAGVDEVLHTRGDAGASSVSYFAHGTTVATNTLLTNCGAPTGLITTEGFRDLLEPGRQRRPKLYDLTARKPAPFVSRDLRMEVPERLRHTGEVERAVDLDSVCAVARKLRDRGVSSVAICFLYSYLSPKHEQQAAQVLAEEFPEALVSLSSDVLLAMTGPT
jgi:N-methylhydantoinase A